MINEFKVKGKDLINKIEELIHQGNVRRIIIKDPSGRQYIELPLTIGVIGTIFAPILAAVGTLAGMAAKFTVEVINIELPEDNINPKDMKPQTENQSEDTGSTL